MGESESAKGSQYLVLPLIAVVRCVHIWIRVAVKVQPFLPAQYLKFKSSSLSYY